MPGTLILAGVCIVLVLLLLLRARKRREGGEEWAGENVEYEMEGRFYEEIAAGTQSCPIARIYSRFDALFIKSLLQSESIPFHINYEYMESSGEQRREIRNCNQMLVSVLERDYHDALTVIESYEANKEKDPRAAASRSVMDGVLLGWYRPPPPSGSGVELIRKGEAPSAE